MTHEERNAMTYLLSSFSMLLWSADVLGADDKLTYLYQQKIESAAMMLWGLGVTNKDGYNRLISMSHKCAGAS